MAFEDNFVGGPTVTVKRPPRLLLISLVMALLLAACSGLAVDENTEQARSTSTSTSTPSTDSTDGAETDNTQPDSGSDPVENDESERAESEPYSSVDQVPEELVMALGELDGKLAIGAGRSIAVSRPDGLAYIELDGDETRISGQPTWSSDGGQLIWSSVSAVSQDARIQFFDDEGVVEGDPVRIPVPGSPVFYFQWRSDDQQILYLRNSGRRQTVEAGVISVGGGAAWMAEGNPFFASWAPEAAVIAGHVADEELLLFDPAGAQLLPEPGLTPPPSDDAPVAGELVAPGGGFSAPAWLDDDRVLMVVDRWLSAVTVSDGSADRLIELEGPVRFVLSPDRKRVALQLAGNIPNDGPIEASARFGEQSTAPSFLRRIQSDNSLLVYNIETGTVEEVTESRAVAWEWSPDSSKLAWLEFDGPVARRRGRWQFWTGQGPVAGNKTAPTLRLSDKELVNYLPFFAQYGQSITRWSPDSSAFALVGTVNGN